MIAHTLWTATATLASWQAANNPSRWHRIEGIPTMSDSFRGDLMERIERLERANKRWRLVSFSALVALVAVPVATGYAFSHREQQNAGQPQPAPPANFTLDRSQAPVTYTNFVHGTITPEELILDLGLNTEMASNPNPTVRISNRVVMNFYTAKRLSVFLQWAVQKYEATYGLIETDSEKRELPGAKPARGGGK